MSAGDALDAAQTGLTAAQARLDAAKTGLDAAKTGLDAAKTGLAAAQAGLDAASPPGALTKVHQVGFNTVLLFMCWLSREVSPATWFKLDKWERGLHYYVFGWLVGLGLILAFGPAVGWPRFVMLGIVFYRLQELMFATLDNALMLTKRGSSANFVVLVTLGAA